MKTAEIRSTYLEHFANRGHRVVPSAPLIPSDDPTILFTVAGMVPFKNALTGLETLPYSRATSCQRCVRAGGKHNDLENVGFTARHHTFFEMLGNFSFGDYFKEEAIEWAWAYVRDVLDLAQDCIWITVHPTDDEAMQLWTKKIGIDPSRVVKHEENFWAMGDTGPCGPCSEIFFDQGSGVAGGPPGSADEDGDRFLEIWNLVFPQFDRQPDGELTPLASPGVDTGSGLERVASVMQGVHSNYEIDIFEPIFKTLAGITKRRDLAATIAEPSSRVIADHLRAAAFLIGDGVLPDREGRGYVLRRIIRRALRHGHKLGISEPFFSSLVTPLLEGLGDAFPFMTESQKRITNALHAEEMKFGETMRRGMELLDDELKTLSSKTLSGDVAFKLYDTFGFPVDLTKDVVREQGIGVDQNRFDELMEEQRLRARTSGQFERQFSDLALTGTVEFLGYEQLVGDATVTELLKAEESSMTSAKTLQAGEEGAVVLNRTGFYGEAGGQIGDIGLLVRDGARFRVKDVTRHNEQFVHHGQVEQGDFEIGLGVEFEVDSIHRQDVARNHSATHLMHAALKEVLGAHVQQRGSLVESSRLRFDFSHDKPVQLDERQQIEAAVNAQILANGTVQTDISSFDEALSKGAVALFGEKYGDEVRVLNMGDGYSVELCGGTHVAKLGEIGLFKITSESSIAAGIRRIEAVTGRQAYAHHLANESLLDELAASTGTKRGQLELRIKQLIEEREELRKKLDDVLTLNLQDRGKELVTQARSIGNVKLVASVLDGDSDSLMSTFDDVRSRLDNAVVVLAISDGAKCQVVCGVATSQTNTLKARDLIEHLGTQVDIRGGGKPEMARAGGNATPAALADALTSLSSWLEARLTP